MDANLTTILDDIERTLAANRPPTRQEARALLVTLGLAVLDELDGIEPAFERAAGWIAARSEPWQAAIQSELAMAVTEHVRSADPRWVSHPQYDLAYAVEARHRLEARLAACERLGIEVPEELLEAMARADAVLAPRLGGQSPPPLADERPPAGDRSIHQE